MTPTSSKGPSRWGNWVILSPILGGLAVVYLVERFAPEAKGHGVPEVMDAIYYKRGHIRGVVAVIKSLASALSIGSGASVGREGPIIQIGSALGSSFSKAIGLSTGQKITLLSAGAGAGIAATFNTPLGGVLFAIEILLPEVSNRTFLPVVVATGAATLVGRILIGPNPAFTVPEILFPSATSFGVEEAIAYRRPRRPVRRRLLGLHPASRVHGGRLSQAAGRHLRPKHHRHDDDRPDDGRPHARLRPFLRRRRRLWRHPVDPGQGHDGDQPPGSAVRAQTAGHLTISLGCGASGGIFSPSLFLGATLGAAFASLAALVLPNAGLTLPSAAIVGMAAMVGAGTGGVMTAIIMVFEMTRDYAIIVPVIVAVAVAAGVRRALIPETIYTVKLRHRGHRIPKERHVNLYLVQQAQDIMERRFILAKAGSTLRECMGWEDVDDLRAIIVEHEGRIVGLIPPRSGIWRETVNNPDRPVGDFVEKRPVVCRDVDLLSLVLARLKRHRSGAAIVFHGTHRPRAADVVGVITKRAIADAVIDNYDE